MSSEQANITSKRKSISKKYFRNPLLRLFFLQCLLIGRIFPRSFLLFIGRGLGKFAYHIFPSERKKALTHLNIAYPEKTESEINEITRNVFKHIGMNFMELIWLPRLKKNNIDKYVEFIGLEHLDKARSPSKPTIIITGHIGNWELLAAAASIKGYSAAVIATKQRDDWINRKISNIRAKWNVHTIWRNGGQSSREILSVMKNNGVLALLMDQDTKAESVFVDFFGHKAFTPSGPAALSLRFNSEVISAYIHRNGNRNHKITFKNAEPLQPTGDREKDIVDRTQQFTKIIEGAINEHPEQWVWMHKRWKTQNPNSNKGERNDLA